MAAVTTSSAAGYNAGKQKCYIETIDQFDKTVFASPGQVITVEFPTLTPTTGSDVSIATNGTITLAADKTYQIAHRVDIVPNINNDVNAGHILYNVTTSSLVTPGSKMGQTNTITVTTAGDPETLVLLAYMPDGTPPNTTTQPKTWQYPQQIENAEISIVEVGGATA